MFRSNATDEELGEMTKTNNPEEIDIESENESEGEAPQGVVTSRVYSLHNFRYIMIVFFNCFAEVDITEKSIPSEVFGTLAKEDD